MDGLFTMGSKMKRTVGLLLFWLSWLLWLVALALPFWLELDSRAAVAVSAMLIAAEVSFAVSLLLLGRPFYQAMKARFKAFVVRRSDVE